MSMYRLSRSMKHKKLAARQRGTGSTRGVWRADDVGKSWEGSNGYLVLWARKAGASVGVRT